MTFKLTSILGTCQWAVTFKLTSILGTCQWAVTFKLTGILGTCQWSVTSPDSWYTVPCECTVGWEGTFCDQDIDGCAQNPCFTACTDVPAAQSATSQFQCDPCPSGMGGNGQTCYDIDECLTTQPCEQNCANTAGSYV